MTSFSRQKYKNTVDVNQINIRRVILPQKKLAQYGSIISQRVFLELISFLLFHIYVCVYVFQKEGVEKLTIKDCSLRKWWKVEKWKNLNPP